jgi:hypothetical protein
VVVVVALAVAALAAVWPRVLGWQKRLKQRRSPQGLSGHRDSIKAQLRSTLGPPTALCFPPNLASLCRWDEPCTLEDTATSYSLYILHAPTLSQPAHRASSCS